MKRFLMLACLAGILPCSEAVAAGGFPFLHTRPKPVFLDNQPSTTPGSPAASQNRVAYHGTAVFPASGRLYMPTAARPAGRAQVASPPRTRFSDLFTRAWHFGESSAARPGSAQTK